MDDNKITLFKCEYSKDKDEINIVIHPMSNYIQLLGGVTVLIRSICKSGMIKFNDFIVDICGSNEMIGLQEKSHLNESLDAKNG